VGECACLSWRLEQFFGSEFACGLKMEMGVEMGYSAAIFGGGGDCVLDALI
jgi:hypothetical protein